MTSATVALDALLECPEARPPMAMAVSLPSDWNSMGLPVCLGGSVFGWLISRSESEAVLDRFYELGGRMIDTADGYSYDKRPTGNDSENIIGSWARSRGVTSTIRICTKVGRSPDLPGLKAATVAEAVEKSRERLGLDEFEVLLAHGDDPSLDPDEIELALTSVLKGSARHVGVSNFSAERIEATMLAASGTDDPSIEIVQEEFHLAAREFESSSLGVLAERAGLTLMASGSLAQGFLTGKFRNATSRVGHRQKIAGARYADPGFERILDSLDQVAARYEVSMAAVALRWIIENPQAFPVASVTSPRQLESFSEAARIELSARDLELLGAASQRDAVTPREESG